MIPFLAHWDTNIFPYTDSLRSLEFANYHSLETYIFTMTGDHFSPVSKLFLWFQLRCFPNSIIQFSVFSILIQGLIGIFSYQWFKQLNFSSSSSLVVASLISTTIASSAIVSWHICQSWQLGVMFSVLSFRFASMYADEGGKKIYFYLYIIISFFALLSMESAVGCLFFIPILYTKNKKDLLYWFVSIAVIIMAFLLSKKLLVTTDYSQVPDINFNVFIQLKNILVMASNGIFIQLPFHPLFLNEVFSIVLLVVFVLGMILFTRKNKFHFRIFLAAFLSILACYALVCLTRNTEDVYRIMKQRYFYVPSLFLMMMLVMPISSFMNKVKKKYWLSAFVILLCVNIVGVRLVHNRLILDLTSHMKRVCLQVEKHLQIAVSENLNNVPDVCLDSSFGFVNIRFASEFFNMNIQKDKIKFLPYEEFIATKNNLYLPILNWQKSLYMLPKHRYYETAKAKDVTKYYVNDYFQK